MKAVLKIFIYSFLHILFFYSFLFFLVTAENAAISFENVTFEYIHGQKILNQLSFTVPPGKNYAIVGGGSF